MSADTTVTKAESSTENENSNKRTNPIFEEPPHRQGRRFENPNFDNRRQNQQGNFRHGGKRPFGRGHDQPFQGGESRNMSERIMHEKLNEVSGPTFDLPILDTDEKKFSGRNRLYIGNIAADATEDDLNEMFQKYGMTSELFVNKEKNFGFIRMDYHHNAEKAKEELNGVAFKGKTLKIRFAPNNTIIKVKNLDDFVTNELLHLAFSVFGEIDRSVVVVDERGKSIGEGIVEFVKKSSFLLALRKCKENCFFLTGSLRPVIVEPYECHDEVDGFSEKFIMKRNPTFFKVRNAGPRFAPKDSFEDEYGLRWKQLDDLYNQKLDALKKENEIEKRRLLAQMEYARYEHETAMLRERLQARELDMDRHKHEWEMKQQQVEEELCRNEEQIRHRQESIQARMLQQEEEIRRRQEENKLFLKAQELDNMVGGQDDEFEGGRFGGPSDSKMPTVAYYSQSSDRNNSGYWSNDHGDVPSKRYRY